MHDKYNIFDIVRLECQKLIAILEWTLIFLFFFKFASPLLIGVIML